MMNVNLGDHRVLVMNSEFRDRINLALGELQGKYAIPVVFEIQRQLELQQEDANAFLDEFEKHIPTRKGAVDVGTPQ